MNSVKIWWFKSNFIYTSLNRTWRRIFYLSLAFCFCYEILFLNITAPVDWFVGLGKFSSQVLYGYCTGFILYFLTVHLPTATKQIKLYRHNRNELVFISEEINKIFRAIKMVPSDAIAWNLLPKEVREGLAKINPNDQVHLHGQPIDAAPSHSFNSFYIFIEHQKNIITQKIHHLLLFQDLISEDTLKYVTYIDNSLSFIDHWKGIIFPNQTADFMSFAFEYLPYYNKMVIETFNNGSTLLEKISRMTYDEERSLNRN